MVLGKKYGMRCQLLINQPVSIDAREEARKVLVVDQRSTFVIELGGLEKLNDFENVALG